MRLKWLILALSVALLGAQTGNLVWDLPTTRTDGSPLTNLAGTRLWCAAQAGGPYGQIADVLVPVTTWGPLPAPPQYCVATAYDSTGLESTYSNEAVYLAQGTPPPQVQQPTVQLTPWQAPPVAITLDAHTESSSATPAAPYTFSHTVGTGATVLFVLFANRNGTDTATVTYAGASMTKVRLDGPTSFERTNIFYKLAPATGSNTVSISDGTPSSMVAQAVSFFGTDTTTAVIDAHNGGTGTMPASVNITSVADNCWIIEVFGMRIAAGETITQGTETGRTDWSPDWEVELGGNESDGGGTYYSNVSPAATKTFSWTESGTGHAWALSAVSIKPAAAVTDIPYRPIQTGFVPRALRTMVAN